MFKRSVAGVAVVMVSASNAWRPVKNTPAQNINA